MPSPSAIAPPATPCGSDGTERCPLCGGPNACPLSGGITEPAACWCTAASVPEELLARVPAEWRGRACLCRNCVTAFDQEEVSRPGSLAAADFYLEDGRMVLTAGYLRRRGYCCDQGCRHCPYQEAGP